MNVLLVLAHPDPNSFNAAVASVIQKQLIQNGIDVRMKDLYRSEFDPRLTKEDLSAIFSGTMPSEISKEQQDVLWANRLVFVYPIWWLDKPALLKGWLDRVMAYGFAYQMGERGPEGLLRHEKALAVQIGGSPMALYQSENWTYALEPSTMDGTFRFMGIEDISIHNILGIGESTREQREQHLHCAAQLVADWK